jgi:sec-independent protein translocase protein TatA
MLRNLSLWHLLILLVVVFLVFGVRRLPELGSGLGKGIREFKKGIKDEKGIEGEAGEAGVEERPVERDPKRLGD